MSHKIRVLSREAETRSFPELENLTQETADVWAERVLRRRYGAYCGGGVMVFGLLLLLPMVLVSFFW